VIAIESIVINAKRSCYTTRICLQGLHVGATWFSLYGVFVVRLFFLVRIAQGRGDEDVVFPGDASASAGIASNASSARTTRK
jgi:hypothetical protein